jgi:hypothetical protein
VGGRELVAVHRDREWQIEEVHRDL